MRPRGFTLLELIIAMTISLLTVAAGVSLLVASQRWFQTGSDDRAMQETARVALDEITNNLRSAGYGMEPTFAFDLGILANTVQDRLPPGSTARFGGYNCPSGNCPSLRDRIDGPDELVFYSRDPLFERDVVSVGANSLVLAGKSTDSTLLNNGQVLQVMCYGSNNQWLWAYVSIATVNSSNPAAVAVTLIPTPGQPADFPYQNGLLGQPCFAAGAASVKAFKIDRYRYYVAAVDTGGNIQPWETPNTHPFLMLDQGLSSGGNPIVTAIAPDVEDLQVAYVYPLAGGEQVLGADLGTPVQANTIGDDTGFNLIPTYPPYAIPSFSVNPNDAALAVTTHHPANIRAVNVAIVVRTPVLDPTVPDATVPGVLNRPDLAGEAGYRRQVFQSAAYTRNLETALPVFPTYDPNYAGANCCPTAGTCAGNCGGG